MGRKSQKQVLEEIYKVLSPDLISIAEIADKIESHHDTVKKCVEFIEIIQGKPKIIVEKTKLRSTTIIRVGLEKQGSQEK